VVSNQFVIFIKKLTYFESYNNHTMLVK